VPHADAAEAQAQATEAAKAEAAEAQAQATEAAKAEAAEAAEDLLYMTLRLFLKTCPKGN
jgi:hypothetical protein